MWFSGQKALCNVVSNIPRPIHYYKYTNKAYYAANNVIFIRIYFVYLPSPKNGHYYKYSAISSVNSAKVSGLKSRYYSVKHQNYPSQYTDQNTLAFPKPEPYEVSAPYLA